MRDTSATVVVERHGTSVAFVTTRGGRRRASERDRGGTLGMDARWTEDGNLVEASVRIPDGSWLVIEPRAGTFDPWGACDRLWRAERPGLEHRGESITVFSSVDHAHPDRIPVLAEPSLVPAGGGSVVLNLIATLARDHGRRALRYDGPYPSEHLFLTLLESFRYDAAIADPVGAFTSGTLDWTPAPHERLFTASGAYVQLRERIEKVVWNGRAYYRPDWQGVARHAPRRVRDVANTTRCSLWALGRAIQDHLTITSDGDVEVLAPPHLADAVAPARSAEWRHPIGETVRDGVIEAVVAASAAPLAPFIRALGARFTIAWGAVDRDLLAVRADSVTFSSALGAVARDLVAAAVDRRAKLGTALATLAEMAALLGDALRARAGAAVADLPRERQDAVIRDEADAAHAGTITAAVEALMAELAAAGSGSRRGANDQPDIERHERGDRHG